MNFLVLVGLLSAAGGQALDPAEAPDPRAELPSAIQHARQLLEDEEYALFLDQFAIPADLKRVVESRDVQDVASAFSKEKAQPLMAVLQQIKENEPVLSEDGTLAEYVVKVKNFSRPRIVFQKVDGLWYLRN